MRPQLQQSVTAVAIAATSLAFPVACALTSKAELTSIRYFSPERVTAHEPHQREPKSGPGLVAVRIGRITSGTNLRERIIHRDSAYEFGYYDEYRWTERPEAFVRRALARSLFETQGLTRSLGLAVPTLDIELVGFDDLLLPAGRAARVQLRYLLYEDSAVLLDETLTFDQRVSTLSPAIEDFVAAMSAALEAAAARIALKVRETLAARMPPPVTEMRP